MRTNPRLELLNDPDKNIWAYISVTKVIPVVMNDFLWVILSIPIIVRSLQMDLHKAHNFPALHPNLGMQFSYILEGLFWQSVNMDSAPLF